MSELAIFEDETRPAEVRLEGETVWLTQKQMAELFGTTSENILMHLKNMYRDEELSESATAKDLVVVRQEGKCQVRRWRRADERKKRRPAGRLFRRAYCRERA